MDSKIEELLDDIENLHYCPGPLRQTVLRFKALQYAKDDELYQIFNLVESHAPGLRLKAVTRYGKMLRSLENVEPSSHKKLIEFVCNNSNDEHKGIKTMQDIVAELPKEWTLVQLTPKCSGNNRKTVEINKLDTPGLYITVFNCGQREQVPFCVEVGPPRDQIEGNVINLQKEIQSIVKYHKESLLSLGSQGYFKNDSEKYEYYSKKRTTDDRLQNLVKDMKNLWLGAWRCLFIPKCRDQKIDESIRTNVKKFCNLSEVHFSNKSEEILFYAIKSFHFFGLQETKNLIKYCLKNESKELRLKVYNFVEAEASKYPHTAEKNPIILIVDDKLDQFCWELIDVLENESVTRLPSLHFVYSIYKEHESTIENGFKIIRNYKNGRYLVNPELDLKKMETRIMSFFKYWTPDWKGVVGSKPNQNEFEDLIASAEIYSYNGHGGGMQYLSADKIEKSKINAVIFLFGCGSTRLDAMGPHVEWEGKWQSYLIALCPLIFGTLWEVTDIETDVLTAQVYSEWVPSEAKTHWSLIDQKIWKASGKVEPMKKAPALNKDFTVEPELLKVICKSKKILSNYSTKAACVARGIPIKLIQ